MKTKISGIAPIEAASFFGFFCQKDTADSGTTVDYKLRISAPKNLKSAF